MKLIPLTQGKFAKVDDEDFDALNQHNWYAWWDKKRRTFYAVRSARCGKVQRQLKMHRVLLNPPRKALVDHESGDGLDNQRHNLRRCTPSQNGANRQKNRFRAGAPTTSKFKGVSLASGYSRFRAVIRRDGKPWHLGYFSDQRSAAAAYDVAARQLRGAFARLNFPENKNLTTAETPVGCPTI